MGQSTNLNESGKDEGVSLGSETSKQHPKGKGETEHIFSPKSPFVVNAEDLPDWCHQDKLDIPDTQATEVGPGLCDPKGSLDSRKPNIDLATSDEISPKDRKAPRTPGTRETDKAVSIDDSGARLDNLDNLIEASPSRTGRLMDDDTISELLSTARGLTRSGKTEAALGRYKRLTRSGAVLQAIISDLESLMTEQDQVSTTLLQTLGDAYMKSNRVDRALELYRMASQEINE